jgi:arylformamidase
LSALVILKVIDISLPLSPDTPVFPGDPPVGIETMSLLSAGDTFRLTRISMSAHAGTHIDTPSHLFVDGGEIENIRLEDLIGPVYVIEFDGPRPLDESACKRMDIPSNFSRILIKNKRPNAWMDETAAEWFSVSGAKLLGWDGLSVDPPESEKLPAHRALLARGVHLVENLDLSQVTPGKYFLACLPLKLMGSDASPVRAVLLEDFV